MINSSSPPSSASRSEDESVDADLGKFGSRIDRDEYLRLRGEYIGLKRGIEPGRPFNPEMRVDPDRVRLGRREK